MIFNQEIATQDLLRMDRSHVWHPYTAANEPGFITPVSHATGVELHLKDGRVLIDGMSSWWSTLHGYNHPVLNKALTDQLAKMAHIMFAGITHDPAARLASTLTKIAPPGLEKVFFSDSGSVAVEVAMKMAFQYWLSKGQAQRTTFMALKRGYHGDTFGAMSICDPHSGMHHLFQRNLSHHLFSESPPCRFDEPFKETHIAYFDQLLQQHRQKIAAVILEPIVQGAGGMHFYSPDYLRRVREICDKHEILLIADEIATGFGRTGKLFACNHAGISPDIMCIGKALSAGYITLAATLCNTRVSEGISKGEAPVFMHGPTYMANPLACAVANASIELLLDSDWEARLNTISEQMKKELAPCEAFSFVTDVRVLGAIGVVELDRPIETNKLMPLFIEQGVWIRPFGNIIYLMPAFIMEPEQLTQLTDAIIKVLGQIADQFQPLD